MISSQLRLTQLFVYCLLFLIWAVQPAIGKTMMPGPIESQAASQPQKDEEVSDRVSVLVHLEPPGKYMSAQMSQMHRQTVKDWAASVGGEVKYQYNVVLPHVINLRNLPRESLRGLQMIPGVVKIEEDRVMTAHLTVSTPLVQGLQNQITSAGYSADGSGVRVCVIDTGIDSDHIMYSDRIDTFAGRDFVNDDDDPEDDNGHGTNVAGIVLGGTGLSMSRCGVSTDIQGIAPKATLIGVKVLDSGGGGWMTDVIAGINYCADQSATGGRSQVINLSLGGGASSDNCDDDSTAMAANNAVDAGVVVVSSSGNDANVNAMGTPACGSKVIAVGAVYDDNFPNCEHGQDSFSWCVDSSCNTILCTDNNIYKDDLICFSNQSETIDIVAPGCVITSAAISPGNTAVSGMCGTSQASPHVAGLAALLLSQDPELSPALVRQHIRDGAVDLGDVGFDPSYGYGRIDVISSLSLLDANCSNDAECDDGLYCNGTESCVDGVCQPGAAVSCSDGVSCTDDSCNEDTDSCDYIANAANCDDGLYCTGTESCDPDIGCSPGNYPCTVDQECNEATDTCDIPICNNNGTCEIGEDCYNCSSDCISGTSGGTDCSACFKGKCDGVCHPKEVGTDCPDCAVSYCCGDGVCEGAESSNDCLIDCPLPFCGDSTCDSNETPCSCETDCGPAPSTETNCTDGVDNDCDDVIDFADPDCSCLPRKEPCITNDECCSNRCFRGSCK